MKGLEGLSCERGQSDQASGKCPHQEVVKHWHRPPSEVADAPGLSVLEAFEQCPMDVL